MNRNIRKVAVLGSGVMGSRIACHFANIGLEVLLLDIVPKEAQESNNSKLRNSITDKALAFAIKSNPAPLYDKSFANRITTGNFDDDLEKIADCDWVIEVIIENLKIKQSLFEKVEQFRKKDTLISSNTSSIPIHLLTEGRSENFKTHFCGTHFFNPPRYLKLLEIIPGKETNQEVLDFLMDYGSKFLGKKTVLCKDTPAFIANRIGVFAIMQILHTTAEMGFSVEEIDKLTGPVIGRPKSASFRTCDVVGIDTLGKVAQIVAENCPNDESKSLFEFPDFLSKIIENKWFGDKSGQGFYKKTKDEKPVLSGVEVGKRIIQQINLKTLEYEATTKPRLELLGKTKNKEKLQERFAFLIQAKGREGDFYRKTFLKLFQYAGNRIPEISDEIYRLDDAVKAGFGYEMGPFETWDAIGFETVLELMQAQNLEIPAWINEMKSDGNLAFYKIEKGKKICYDLESKTYKPIPGTENLIVLDHIRKNNLVYENSDASIIDLGDGILNVEFHSKMNSIGGGTIQAINKAIDLAEKDFRGLVIGNDGTNFSAGANIGMIFMLAAEQEYEEIDLAIRQFQNMTKRCRQSAIPVVAAIKGMVLGGGCETSMHCDKVVAASESYMGLVELGVGVIPGGGGTKEMALRVSDSSTKGDVVLNRLGDAYMNIAMAKVASSAHEALNMNYIRKTDRIEINSDFLISEAKNAAIELAEAGYSQPSERKDILVQGKTGIAIFQAGVNGLKMGRYASDHDVKIAGKLAYVLAGGDLSYPQKVSEQYLLDLEREAFLSLCGERKTLERLEHMIKTGKPLRN